MEFALTEEQEMLRKSARDFLNNKCSKTLVREMEEDFRGYPPDLWQEMAALGWLGLAFPEQYGGSGATFLELAVLLEEMGRACLPGPYFSTVVLGGQVILEAGSESQKRALLPRLTRGDLLVALALTEPSARYDRSGIDVRAAANGDDFIINGTKLFISDAHVAECLVCVAKTDGQVPRGDGITLFMVNSGSPGIDIVPLPTIAKDRQCEIGFKNVRVSANNILGGVNRGWSVVEKVLQRAAVAKCAEMVGGAQKVLDMTVNYAKERVQFGRPIGSFQAIQHSCANMAIEMDGCRFITYKVAWMISQGMPCAREASIAKSWVSEAYRRIAAAGIQIHGGVGFTKDHDMQLYYRRAKAAEVLFGDGAFHRGIIAQEMGI